MSQDSCPNRRWEEAMQTSNVLNFTLAKRRHERPEGLWGIVRDTWPFSILAPELGSSSLWQQRWRFTMLLFVSPPKPMDSVPVRSTNQLTVTPNLQAESSFPLMVPGGQRDAGKMDGPFPCRYNTQSVNSPQWTWWRGLCTNNTLQTRKAETVDL